MCFILQKYWYCCDISCCIVYCDTVSSTKGRFWSSIKNGKFFIKYLFCFSFLFKIDDRYFKNAALLLEVVIVLHVSVCNSNIQIFCILNHSAEKILAETAWYTMVSYCFIKKVINVTVRLRGCTYQENELHLN